MNSNNVKAYQNRLSREQIKSLTSRSLFEFVEQVAEKVFHGVNEDWQGPQFAHSNFFSSCGTTKFLYHATFVQGGSPVAEHKEIAISDHFKGKKSK